MSTLKLPNGEAVEVHLPAEILDLLDAGPHDNLAAVYEGRGRVFFSKAGTARASGVDVPTSSDLLGSAVKGGDVPYLAIHPTDVKMLSGEFNVSGYNGLLFCHTVGSAQSLKLFSYWKSKDAFTQYGEGFVKERATAGAADSGGKLSAFYPRKKLWLRKSTFWTGFITAAAFVAAVVALWDSAAQLVEFPDADVQLVGGQDRNILSTGSGGPVKFNVVNRCRYAPVTVLIETTFEPAQSGNQRATAGTSKESVRIGRIGPGESRDFQVSATLGSPQDSIPSAYAFHIKAIISAAWFHTAIDKTSPSITIWDPIAGTPPRKAFSTNGRCLASGVLYSGSRQSATVFASATHPTHRIESLMISATVDGQPVISSALPRFSSGSGRSVNQQLSVPGLEPFLPYDYSVDVGWQGMTSEDCTKVTITPIFKGGPR